MERLTVARDRHYGDERVFLLRGRIGYWMLYAYSGTADLRGRMPKAEMSTTKGAPEWMAMNAL